MIVWVDSYKLQTFLWERGIYPIKESGKTAFYINNEAYREASRSFKIQKLFYRSHKWENGN